MPNMQRFRFYRVFDLPIAGRYKPGLLVSKLFGCGFKRENLKEIIAGMKRRMNKQSTGRIIERFAFALPAYTFAQRIRRREEIRSIPKVLGLSHFPA
jgi:hypothetical protein